MATLFTKKDGTTKYYATYQSAWNKAARLNETETNGQWLFEMDTNGWYLEFFADETTKEGK